jgi:hypothetical protein
MTPLYRAECLGGAKCGFGGLLWLLAACAAWVYLGNYFAPDACLDALHGSFDYEAWECSLRCAGDNTGRPKFVGPCSEFDDGDPPL